MAEGINLVTILIPAKYALCKNSLLYIDKGTFCKPRISTACFLACRTFQSPGSLGVGDPLHAGLKDRVAFRGALANARHEIYSPGNEGLLAPEARGSRQVFVAISTPITGHNCL